MCVRRWCVRRWQRAPSWTFWTRSFRSSYTQTRQTTVLVRICFKRQTPEGKELPIAFLSKSLTAERLRWSVPEKEACAIVYAFQQLECVLRDMHFTLRTDHKNLLYINEDGSAKVRRWKLAT